MNEREKNDQRCQLLGLDKMMTKDEAKELTEQELYEKLFEITKLPYDYYRFNTIIIRQNWPQISNQLDDWFTETKTTCLHKEITYWWEVKEFNSDPIGWMLRAYVASKW